MSVKHRDTATEDHQSERTQALGPGSRLRIAREAARLSLAEVAKHLHLTSQLIHDIEQDDYSRAPSFVFVRGYLRAYANLVLLPADDIVAGFNHLGLEEAPSNRPRRSFTHHRNQADHWLRWFGMILLLGMLSITAIWWSHYKTAKPTIAMPKISTSSPTVSAPTAKTPTAAAPSASAPSASAPNALTSDVAAPNANQTTVLPIPPQTTIPTPDNTVGQNSNGGNVIPKKATITATSDFEQTEPTTNIATPVAVKKKQLRQRTRRRYSGASQ